VGGGPQALGVVVMAAAGSGGSIVVRVLSDVVRAVCVLRHAPAMVRRLFGQVPRALWHENHEPFR
jgi:hypothetical protein